MALPPPSSPRTLRTAPPPASRGGVGLAQGRYGIRGNLEFVLCDEQDGLWVLWFNSDPQETSPAPGGPPPGEWSGALRFATGRRYDEVAVLQSRHGPHHLELIARSDATTHRLRWSPEAAFTTEQPPPSPPARHRHDGEHGRHPVVRCPHRGRRTAPPSRGHHRLSPSHMVRRHSGTGAARRRKVDDHSPRSGRARPAPHGRTGGRPRRPLPLPHRRHASPACEHSVAAVPADGGARIPVVRRRVAKRPGSRVHRRNTPPAVPGIRRGHRPCGHSPRPRARQYRHRRTP